MTQNDMPLPYVRYWDTTLCPKRAGNQEVTYMEHQRHGAATCLSQKEPQQRPLGATLAFERALFQNPRLSVFRRNATTWEVLLILAEAPQEDGPGLYELVAAVQTRALGPSALLQFLRDRRDEGSIIFTRHSKKKSKWSLSLRDDLRAELMGLIGGGQG